MEASVRFYTVGLGLTVRTEFQDGELMRWMPPADGISYAMRVL
jgi:hypothetical protein